MQLLCMLCLSGMVHCDHEDWCFDGEPRLRHANTHTVSPTIPFIWAFRTKINRAGDPGKGKGTAVPGLCQRGVLGCKHCFEQVLGTTRP